ncbi:MAG TPA: hypothetical protein VFC02_13135, partial [Anaerolineales bacterium]|nr:hypothetical protein [Anaerolineales bacterium]
GWRRVGGRSLVFGMGIHCDSGVYHEIIKLIPSWRTTIYSVLCRTLCRLSLKSDGLVRIGESVAKTVTFILNWGTRST